MAKQLDISSFFFKKPARAPSPARQDEEAPAATEAGMKRKTPTERHATRDDDGLRGGSLLCSNSLIDAISAEV